MPEKFSHDAEPSLETAEMFLDYAADSLANFKMPDFSTQEEFTVCDLACEVFGHGSTMSEEYFLKLQQKVSELSSGSVRLEKVELSDWKGPRVKGACSYLVLVKGEERVPFIFGGYIPPFQAFRNS